MHFSTPPIGWGIVSLQRRGWSPFRGGQHRLKVDVISGVEAIRPACQILGLNSGSCVQSHCDVYSYAALGSRLRPGNGRVMAARRSALRRSSILFLLALCLRRIRRVFSLARAIAFPVGLD